MGKRKVFGLYVRNFWSEILRHRPADRDHLDVRAVACLDTNRFCSATFTSTRAGATDACRSARSSTSTARPGHFDVIAITDHILMKRDLLARVGAAGHARVPAVLRDRGSVRRLSRRDRERSRAGRSACTTCSSFPAPKSRRTTSAARRTRTSSALNLKEYISADQPADDILKEIRRQGALSIACHPHHRTTRRIEIGTCYLWDHRKRVAELVDVWEAANRDDLFSVTSLKHYPYVANSDFHKPKHLYSWKTLVALREELGGDRAGAARRTSTSR